MQLLYANVKPVWYVNHEDIVIFCVSAGMDPVYIDIDLNPRRSLLKTLFYTGLHNVLGRHQYCHGQTKNWIVDFNFFF